MMFGKEFISQMVPEWKEAYMDYRYLKSLLRAIRLLKQTNRSQATPPSLERIPSLYRAFSGLIERENTTSPTTSNPSPKSRDTTIDIENQVIVVNSENHETMFLKTGEEGGECEMMYFKKLDDEFNKVVEFYKFKVKEVVKEAEVLNKQMEALIAFRIKVELSPRVWFDQAAEMTRLASDVAASTAALSASSPSSNRTKSGPGWEVEMGRRDSLTASKSAANNNIPGPNSDVATLVAKFQNLGLTLNDMVTLSGAHTFGKARCSTFSSRLNSNGNSNGPDMNLDFLESLQQLCSESDNNTTLAQLDLVTPSTFDNQYYINLITGEGLLASDQALVTGDDLTREIVESYVGDPAVFFEEFKRSMLKMGSLGALTGENGEIRRNCRSVN